MFKTLTTTFMIVLGISVDANAQEFLFGKEATLKPKIYCVNITNVKNRANDLHYKIRACPADGSPCLTKWTKKKLEYHGRRVSHSQGHCTLKRKPVKMIISYDWSASDAYEETTQEVTPQAFEWRERWPEVGCIRRAVYRFAPYRGQSITIKRGLRRGQRFAACRWKENTQPNTPRGKTDLPDNVLGGWVRRRGQCPGPGNPAARDKNMLWVQPHGIDNADGSCWLSGTFNLGKRFIARAMCPAGHNKYKIVDFTFDRISGNRMRLREGRKRRQRYKRCAGKWLPSPRDQRFASEFTGKKISFNATVRIRLDTGKMTFDHHKRIMNLEVDAWGLLRDRQDFGYRKKSSKGRVGEIVRDSDGRRVGWLVKDGKLVRVRERHTYYEIFSWPLTADGKDIECKMRVDEIAKKGDGVRKLLTRTGRLTEVLGYSWNGEKCWLGDDVLVKKLPPAAAQADCNSGNPDRTIRGCSAIIATGKSDVTTAHYSRGKAFKRKKQYQKAIDDFSRVLARHPKNGLMLVSSYNERAGAYQKLQKFDLAIKDYTAALELHHRQKIVRISKSSLYSNRGGAYTKNRQFNRAMADLKKSIELNPKNAHAYFNRGLAFALQKQYVHAISDYTRALKLNKKFTLIYSQRGDAYGNSGQHQRAIDDYDRALRANPNDTDSRINRAKAIRQLAKSNPIHRNVQTAKAALDGCAKPKKLTNSSIIENRVRDCTAVLKDYYDDIAKVIGAYNNRGEAYRQSRRYKKAIADFTQAIKEATYVDSDEWQKPKLLNLYLTVYRNRGWAYIESENYAAAIPDFTKWLAKKRTDYWALVERGIAYAETNNAEKAAADYRAALKINPRGARTHYRSRSAAYKQAGGVGRAKAAELWLKVNGPEKRKFPRRNLDHCIKTSLIKKPRPDSRGRGHELKLYSTCPEEIVAGAYALLEPKGGHAYKTKLPAHLGGVPSLFTYWALKLPRDMSPDGALQKFVFWGVPAKSFAAACPGKAVWTVLSRCIEKLRGAGSGVKENLAAVYFLRGRTDAVSKARAHLAVLDLTKAIKLTPKADYYAWRGIARLELPFTAVAKKLIGVNPHKVEAIFDFERALKINPKHKTALYQLSKLGIKSKFASPILLCENGATPKQTIERCTDVIKQASDKPILARAHIKRGTARNDRARKIVFDASTGTQTDPTTKKFKLKYDKTTRIPRFKLAARHKKAAFADFKKAAKIDPRNPWPFYHLGSMWASQAKKDKTSDKARKYKVAIGLYLRALKVAPKNRKICWSLARAYARADIPDKPKIDSLCPKRRQKK